MLEEVYTCICMSIHFCTVNICMLPNISLFCIENGLQAAFSAAQVYVAKPDV